MIFVIPPGLIATVSIFDSFFQELIDFSQDFRLMLLIDSFRMRQITIFLPSRKNCFLGITIESNSVFSLENIENFPSIGSHSQRIHRGSAFFDGISQEEGRLFLWLPFPCWYITQDHIGPSIS